MLVSPQTLPDDPERLKMLVTECSERHAALEQEVAALAQEVGEKGSALAELQHLIAEQRSENTWLREQLLLLRQKHFGASSERLSEEQLLLMLQAEGARAAREVPEPAAGAVTVKEHQRGHGGRRPLPEAWPRIEVLHDLPEDQKICPQDGQPLKRIGEEISEQLSYTPAQMRVLRHVRPKYACPVCEEGVAIAPPPPQLIPKSMAAPSLLAHVAVSKYADAVPLYRQTKVLERHGADLPRSTLASWMIRSGEAVQPLINLSRDVLLQGFMMQCDETRQKVLKEPGKSAQSWSYIWAQRGGPPGAPVILFDYDPSRSGEVPKRLLAGFEGRYLQVDGYTGYDAFFRENPGVRRVGCWAHQRRKFDEAFKVQQQVKGKRGKSRQKQLKTSKALEGLNWIRKLYEVERQAAGLSAEERYRLRQARGQPILAAIKEWLQQVKPQVPPKSLTGRALGYLSDHWENLVRYLEDGRLEIDNNAVENAIRPIALGRKNIRFSDTVRGAEAGANLYSLIETAKANGLEPQTYLCLVFRDLPSAACVEDYERLLPTRWTADSVRAALDEGGIPT
ncbi:MAG: IS66 family transposase [Candidatus Eisenbacteria bacterium]|nr:IS66 family transposase [Candidatus Eisenbacteria bacterium]